MNIADLVLPGEVKDLATDRSELGKAAGGLVELLGSHVLAIIAYGSWVYGTQKHDSMMDFLVVVDSPGQFYAENKWLTRTPAMPFTRSTLAQTAINLLGPNFYHIDGIDGGKVKIGVISQGQFENANSWLGNYVGFRLTKPLSGYPVQASQLPQDKLEKVIAEARLKTLQRTLGIMPWSFSLDEFAVRYVGISYEADLRPEDPRKVRTTYEASKEQLDRMSQVFLDEQVKLSKFERDSVQAADDIAASVDYVKNAPPRAITFKRAVQKAYLLGCKPVFALHSLRSAFTAAHPMDYARRKIRMSRG